MTMPLPPTNKPSPHVKQLTKDELIRFMSFHGLSDSELAEKLGKSERTIEAWKQGLRNICLTTSKLIRLLDKYPQLLREV